MMTRAVAWKSVPDFGWGQFVGRAPRQQPGFHGFVSDDAVSRDIGFGFCVGRVFEGLADLVEERGLDIEDGRFGLGHAGKLTCRAALVEHKTGTRSA
jgi:hypothetical protein